MTNLFVFLTIRLETGSDEITEADLSSVINKTSAPENPTNLMSYNEKVFPAANEP